MHARGARSYRLALVLLTGLAACAEPEATTDVRRKALILSMDALSEGSLRALGDTTAVRTLLRVFEAGSCAASARPAFPAATAASHAAIWTGATSLENGIVGSTQLRSPAAEFPLDSLVNGFNWQQLEAEPIWITAARAGRRVFANQVTQAPFAPGYQTRSAPQRAEAEGILAGDAVRVLNGYNREVEPHRIMDETTLRFSIIVPPGAIPSARPRVAARVPIGDTAIFLIAQPSADSSALWVASDLGAASRTAVPVREADSLTATLERVGELFVAVPVTLGDGAETSVSVRAYQLRPDLTRFTVFVTSTHVLEGNTDEVEREYRAATRGWIGNSALSQWQEERFGPRFVGGWMGTAEWRAMESAALLVDRFLAGWRHGQQSRNDLLIDYLPLLDDTEHALLGAITLGEHGVPIAAAQAMRARLWGLADEWLAQHLIPLDSGAIVVLTGDHGMRPTNRILHVNVLLQRAGLLRGAPGGSVDLSRTQVWAPNGYWVTANTARRSRGIVAAADVAAVLDSAERVLRRFRDRDGTAVVTGTWRSDASGMDTLGIGGDRGGDLYYDLAPGYRWSADLAGVPVSAARPEGTHGFPSAARDMHTVLCLFGPTVIARRVGDAALVDVAPTVSEWLGIPAPRHATGRSLLGALRGAGGGPPSE